MDHFVNIDWNPALEDIIDETFINDDRLEEASAMHRMLRGSFKNPLANIEEDYRSVCVNNLDNFSPKKLPSPDKTHNKVKEPDKQIRILSKKYVPGISKGPIKFQKYSKLSSIQQALCLRVLLRFSASQIPELTTTAREELNTYMALKGIIDQEQEDYLALVKKNWNDKNLTIICNDYIDLKWRFKMQRATKLPRYYKEIANIAFVKDYNVVLKYIDTCFKEGQIFNLILPNAGIKYVLQVTSESLEENFPIPHTFPMHYNLSVSQDDKCESLANQYNVDLVISSSGLNCLANNIGSDHSNSWILPVVIKSNDTKNIIYIDKPLPPCSSTIIQKNTWVHKYILRKSFVHSKCERSTMKESLPEDDNLFNITSEEILKLEDQHDFSLDTDDVTNQSKISSIDNPKKDLIDNTEPIVQGQDNGSKQNVSYGIFNLMPQCVDQNELLKTHLKREYKLLVRTKTDGSEKSKCIMLAPKLEHQTPLGAEAVTLEEGTKQWIGLMFRPNTLLARVRISARTQEIIQIEKRTPQSVSNEIKRLYNVKVEDSLTLLYNVTHTLINMTPGNYIIKHTANDGLFATVHKTTDEIGTNTFDLHASSIVEKYETITNSPWPVIDKGVITPMLEYFQRMPAMFRPKVNQSFPPSIKKKKKRKLPKK